MAPWTFHLPSLRPTILPEALGAAADTQIDDAIVPKLQDRRRHPKVSSTIRSGGLDGETPHALSGS
jgi:hypothetical protein